MEQPNPDVVISIDKEMDNNTERPKSDDDEATYDAKRPKSDKATNNTKRPKSDEATNNTEQPKSDQVPHNAHNGKPVTKMAISPQSKCIVTYSEVDDSFVCWSITEKSDDSQAGVEKDKQEEDDFYAEEKDAPQETEKSDDSQAEVEKAQQEEDVFYAESLRLPSPKWFRSSMNFKVSDKKIIIID